MDQEQQEEEAKGQHADDLAQGRYPATPLLMSTKEQEPRSHVARSDRAVPRQLNTNQVHYINMSCIKNQRELHELLVQQKELQAAVVLPMLSGGVRNCR